MNQKAIDRIIKFIKEEAPTMNTGSTPGKPGFSSKAPAKGPTAGFDPVIDKKMDELLTDKMVKRKRPRYIWLKGVRKNWKGESK